MSVLTWLPSKWLFSPFFNHSFSFPHFKEFLPYFSLSLPPSLPLSPVFLHFVAHLLFQRKWLSPLMSHYLLFFLQQTSFCISFLLIGAIISRLFFFPLCRSCLLQASSDHLSVFSKFFCIINGCDALFLSHAITVSYLYFLAVQGTLSTVFRHVFSLFKPWLWSSRHRGLGGWLLKYLKLKYRNNEPMLINHYHSLMCILP